MSPEQHETVSSAQQKGHTAQTEVVAIASDTHRQDPLQHPESAPEPSPRSRPESPQDFADDYMSRTAQLGIIIIALGIISTLIGLFPGIAGSPPIGDVGRIQITVILGGFCLQIFGAWVYVRYNFYPRGSVNLIQQIGIRLTWTGLLFSLLSGYADILGFGSHGGSEGFFFGRGQAVGLVGGFLFASIGLIIYALAGQYGGPTKT